MAHSRRSIPRAPQVPISAGLGYPASQPINPAGAITGTYFDASGIDHGFLRAARRHLHQLRSRRAPHSQYPRASTRRGPSQGFTLTQAAWTTASCGRPTAPSPRSMPRAHIHRSCQASTRRGLSWDCTLTRAACFTASCAPRRHHHRVRCPRCRQRHSALPGSTRRGLSRDFTTTRFRSHGFLRAPHGTFTTFDPPGSTGTSVGGINPGGAITGSYFDVNGFVSQLRAGSRRHLRSLPWMYRAPQPRSPVSLTRKASSRENTSTQAARLTAFCGFRKPISLSTKQKGKYSHEPIDSTKKNELQYFWSRWFASAFCRQRRPSVRRPTAPSPCSTRRAPHSPRPVPSPRTE